MNFFSLVIYQNPLFSFQYICLRVFMSCFLSASAAHSTNSFSKIPHVRIRISLFHCTSAISLFKKTFGLLIVFVLFLLGGSQNKLRDDVVETSIESVVLCASKLFEITPSYYCVILHALTDNCMVLTVSFDYE